MLLIAVHHSSSSSSPPPFFAHVLFGVRCSVVQLSLLLHCLPSLQHNMIPSGFVPFNHGYPIRFEAIGFLWSLVLALQSPSGPAVPPTSAAGTPSIMSPRNGAGSPSPLSDSFGRGRGSGVTARGVTARGVAARGVEGAALGPARVLLAEVAHRVTKSGLVASERLRLWKLRDAALQVRSRTFFRNTEPPCLSPPRT